MYVFSEKDVHVSEKTRTCFFQEAIALFILLHAAYYVQDKLLLFFVALLFYGLNLLDTFLDIRMAHEKVPQQIRTVILDHNRYRRLIQSHK